MERSEHDGESLLPDRDQQFLCDLNFMRSEQLHVYRVAWVSRTPFAGYPCGRFPAVD